VTEREERIALNETIFRDVNERVEEVLLTLEPAPPKALEIFCECGRADCLEKITVPLSEYEDVRSRPERFLTAPGHNVPDVEDVVAQRAGYWVVEKLEEEAQIAREGGPRAQR
jgi:hypothetical protein